MKQNGIPRILFNVLFNFLCQKKQRVVLNGQHLSWISAVAGDTQGSIVGPLFFMIYINDLSDGLTSILKPKLFADGTSLLPVAQILNSAANSLNRSLTKISNWAF